MKYIIYGICFGVSGNEFLHVHAQLQYVNCRVSVPDPHKISCFEVLDVLFRGLKASPVAWASFIEA